MKAACASHSSDSAWRAFSKAGSSTGMTVATPPGRATNSALQSRGRRSVTNSRKAARIFSGFCVPTNRKLIFALASAGITVLKPAPI